MGRTTKPLSNTYIQKIKPKSKEFIKSDGAGLYIRVLPTGSKFFYFAYKWNGKHKKIKIGKYPDLSLIYAREKAQEFRSLLAQNIEPMEYQKEQQKERLEKNINFSDLANKWKDKRLLQGKQKEKTILEAFRRVEMHLFPIMGGFKIEEVTIKNIFPLLAPMRGSNTLYKLNIALKQIFQFAEDEGLIIKNPLRRIHEDFYYNTPRNQPTIKPEKLPDFFKVFLNANINIQTSLLIEWQLLTMLRPSEAVGVEWSDVDFKNKSLHIPAERMKGGKRAHDVPLSSQALAVLEKMKTYTNKRKFIFSSLNAPYIKPMSKETANVALKRMGFKGILVAHGLRSIASTYLHELDKFSSEAIELCLSHENGGKVRKAYDRSRKWKSRAIIMQKWGDYVEACKIKAMKS
ncbi:tyrosine-type recombinase/integrase [Histophilus somni]|uniref:tyrosine-type recombinase/integrase n=1 Tax=Histophilus somni TaxID=731 RepID=UPI00201F2E4E|nr:integrase arm-type DNA-binding domain-containing protein [Histophilus somni]